MITNEERKQVAARLRDINPDECVNCVSYCDALEDAAGCYIDQRWLGIELCDRLADLIEPEERTCQMIPTFITPTTLDNIQEYTCSKCGKQTLSEVLGDDEDVPKYCSYCGAKVPENLWE